MLTYNKRRRSAPAITGAVTNAKVRSNTAEVMSHIYGTSATIERSNTLSRPTSMPKKGNTAPWLTTSENVLTSISPSRSKNYR